MEIYTQGRRRAPNATTGIIDSTINVGSTGINKEKIIPLIVSQSIASPGHTKEVIGSMGCIDNDGLHECRPYNCVFGFSGERTFCPRLENGTQPNKENYSSGKLIFLPQEYQRIAGGFYNPIFRERMIWQAINIFEQNGYIVAEDEHFNSDNPHHLGLFYENPDLDLDNKIKQALAENNIDTVPKIEFESHEPVFAKHKHSDKGRFKFLLETEEQKARLKAWLVFTKEIDKDYLLDLDFASFIDEIDGLVDYFSHNPEKFDKSLFDDWEFQKFVEPGHGYLSKIRAITDMFGNISYAYTRVQPATTDILHKQTETHPLRLAYMNRENLGYSDISENLLVNPLSPFFLYTRDVVTNSQKNGYSIPLNGQRPVNTNSIRRYLENQNINPDNPQLPLNIARATSRIGQLYRSLWPYCAPDFMFDPKTGKYFYLETNLLPELFANDVPGGTREMNRTQLHKLFMRQIASVHSKDAGNPRLFPHLNGGMIIS